MKSITQINSKRFLIIFLIFSFFCFLSIFPIIAKASPDTIYVNSSTGNDTTGDGSESAPYKTFHKAYTMSSNEDTLDLTGTFTWSDADEIGDVSTLGYVISKNLTIQGQGPNQTIFQAGTSMAWANGRRVFTIDDGMNVTFNAVAIRYGYIPWDRYTTAKSSGGGGIYSTGTLTVINSDIYSNFAGGCHYCGIGWGGGIYNSGTATISNTSFHGNQAWYGGAGIATIIGTTYSTNNTFYSNTGVGDQSNSNYGGGLAAMSGASVYITNNTIYGNSALNNGGLYIEGASTNVYLKNSIIVGNTSSSNSSYSNIRLYSGTLNNNGYNIVGKSTGFTATTGDWYDSTNSGTFTLTLGGTGSLNIDSQATINDNSAKTYTYAILVNSVAIDNGNNSANNGVSIPVLDQRGAGRSGNTDIGAFEYNGTGLTVIEPTIQTSNFVFSAIDYKQMTVSWTNGNGDRRIVFAKQGNAGTANLSDGMNYTASSVFGSGDEIGSTGWHAIYNGFGTSVTLTNLIDSTDYIFQAFEYNGITESDRDYLSDISTNNPKVQPSHTPVTIYTDSSAPDGGNGSVENPFNNFTSAYNSAVAGDTIDMLGTFTWSDLDETGDTSVRGFSINKDIIIKGHGAGQSIIQAGSTYSTGNGKRVFTIIPNTIVSIEGVTIRYGYVSWPSYTDTYGKGGGGIANYGTLNLSDSEVYENWAGGCLYCSSGYGGGLYNEGTTRVADSSFYSNGSWYTGAGVASRLGTFTITNSTIFQNTTNGDQSSSNYGGGIGITGGEATITNCTITANVGNGSGTASSRVGGFYMSGASTNVYLKNTIIARNTANSNSAKNNFYKESGTLNNNGYNVIGKSTSFVPTNGDWIDSTDSGTFTLHSIGTTGQLNLASSAEINDAENQVKTYALLSNSIAINNAGATANNGVSIPLTDERGAGRNGNTDIGAFEYEGIYVVNTPTEQSNEVTFSSVGVSDMTISWQKGNGSRRIVFVKQGNSGTAIPIDGTTYSADSIFGNGDQIGTSGWYAVYNDSGNTFDITGLASGTEYIVHVVEYNGITEGTEKYIITSSTNNPNTQTTGSANEPTTQADNIIFSNVLNDRMTIEWENGNGNKRVVFMKASEESVNASPIDNTIYTANTIFSSGTQIGSTGWYAIYNDTGTSVTVTGLSASTNYYVQVFEYNEFESLKNYLTTIENNNPKSQNTTVVSAPITRASEIVFSSIGGSQMTISWTNGDGAKRVVFVKQGSSSSSSPVDETTYTANSVFGSGSQIGSTGWYTVYNNTGSSVTVTGLLPSTTYRVHVVEYNGDTGDEIYLLGSNLNNPNNQVTNNEIEIGTGTSTANNLPWANYYRYSFSQMIYTNTEIGSDGSIESIKFKYNGNNTYTWNPLVVYMGHTTKSQFTSSTDWEPIGNLVQVYSGSVSVIAGTPNWYTITLNTPFQYNGTDNLLIAIDNNQNGYASSSSRWYYTTALSYKYIFSQSDSTNINPSSPGSGNRSSDIPNIILNLTAPDSF